MDIFDLEDYKDPIFYKYNKWMVSSYKDIPYYMHTSYETILTAAFLRYGTVIHFRELSRPNF